MKNPTVILILILSIASVSAEDDLLKPTPPPEVARARAQAESTLLFAHVSKDALDKLNAAANDCTECLKKMTELRKGNPERYAESVAVVLASCEVIHKLVPAAEKETEEKIAAARKANDALMRLTGENNDN
jgi:hypothetical protein